jgi:hypothetical protein
MRGCFAVVTNNDQFSSERPARGVLTYKQWRHSIISSQMSVSIIRRGQGYGQKRFPGHSTCRVVPTRTSVTWRSAIADDDHAVFEK